VCKWVIRHTSDKKVNVEHLISKMTHKSIVLKFWIRVWCLFCMCDCFSLDVDGTYKCWWFFFKEVLVIKVIWSLTKKSGCPNLFQVLTFHLILLAHNIKVYQLWTRRITLTKPYYKNQNQNMMNTQTIFHSASHQRL